MSEDGKMERNRNTDLTAMVVLAAITAAKLFFAAYTGLAGDEAYYWQWSRHLAWGYHDHPPMVAYLIRMGTALLGHTVVGMRFGPLVLSTISGWLIYRLSRDTWRSGTAGLWCLAFFLATPMLSAGTLLATPDSPVLFFWLLAVLLTVEAVRRDRFAFWVLLGLAVGLGMLSKYTMVLLPAGLVLAFLSHPDGRRLFMTRGPWAAMVTATLVLLPHLIWQLQNAGGSIIFQLRHGLGPAAGGKKQTEALKTFTDFLAGQVGFVTPLVFALFLLVLWVAARRAWAGTKSKTTTESWPEPLVVLVLLAPALLTFAVFSTATLLTRGEANWPEAAYLTGFVLLGGFLAGRTGPVGNRLRKWGVAAVGTASAITLFAYVEFAFELLPLKAGPVENLHDRSEFVALVQSLREQTDPQARILASNYRLASLLAFYLPDQPETDAPFEVGSGSAYHDWRKPITGPTNGLYLTRFPDSVEDIFSDYRLVDVLTDERRGVSFGSYYVYYGPLDPDYFPSTGAPNP